MINYSEIKFTNPGVLIADIPKDVYSVLTDSIEKAISKKDTLAPLKLFKLGVAGIKESIKFNCPTVFTNYIDEFVKEYYNYYGNFKPKTVELAETWLNLQKKTEYRPVHFHESDISFVVWYKIPYNLKDEDAYENSYKTGCMPNGRFQFMVNSFTGSPVFHLLDVDKSYEGKIILFHSKIPHSVFPFFTSDEYRISLAGNANIKF